MSQKQKNIAALMLNMNPDLISVSTVSIMPSDMLDDVSHLVQVKSCYGNAARVGKELGAKSVILGGAVLVSLGGIVIEHAWLEMEDGTQYDPTLQKLSWSDGSSFEPGVNLIFYKAIEIPLIDYKRTQRRLGLNITTPLAPIDFRRAPEQKELFNYDWRKLMKEVSGDRI